MIGNRFGDYDVLSQLGSGGMGTVYRARCVVDGGAVPIGTEVALKIIHPHLLSRDVYRQRFRREAAVGLQVRHECVVQTHACQSVTVDATPQDFLVMEFVEGGTLRELLVRLKRVPEELCRHIGAEVARGLTAVHTAGVLHRDVKPENVLVTDDHVVKLMDLGVARLQDEAIRLSQTGAFVGSIEYAAPEQFRAAEDAGQSADLHALGLVLYELASGQHPYRDEQPLKTLDKILNDKARRLGAVNPQVSPFLEEVVHTLLEKDPERRFTSAAELAEVLAAGESSAWWGRRSVALRTASRQPLRRIRIPRETALFGREADMEVLQDRFKRAVSGTGQVLLLAGEAGIGKTRLVDEFIGTLRDAGEDVDFLFASYPPGSRIGGGAFRTAFLEHLGEAGVEEALHRYLPETPLLVPSFAAFLKGVPAPAGAAALSSDALDAVFARLLQRLAAERPVVLLIDDLHFASDDGRALFASVARAVSAHRILLLGTLRPGTSEAWRSTMQERGADVRHLARLGPRDLAALLEDAFQSERLANALGHKIAVKCDGNPFFAFEIIRDLRDGKFITRGDDGSWISTREIEEIQIPSSVMDMIQGRISGLSSEERNLLELAACCGFSFDPGLVGSVLDLPRLAALQAFARIEREHRLIRSAGMTYVFDHHQVQEALYEGLFELLRREYHTELAKAIEARGGTSGAAVEELDGDTCLALCQHHLSGTQPEKAVPYLLRALDHLARAYQNDRVMGLCDRALGLDESLDDRQRVEILLRKVERLNLLGRRQEQAAAVTTARGLSEDFGAVGLRARVLTAAGESFWNTGQQDAAMEQLEQARAIYEEIGDKAGEASAINLMGNVCGQLGRFPESIALFRRALALRKEIGDADGIAASTINIGTVFMDLGRMEECRAQFEEGIELAQACGNPRWEAIATSNLGLLMDVIGETAGALEPLERALELHRQIGNRKGEARTIGNIGGIDATTGDWGRALELYKRALIIDDEVGNRVGVSLLHGNIGSLLFYMGAYEEARGWIEKAYRIANEIGDRGQEGNWQSVLALVDRYAGRTEGVEQQFDDSLALMREVGYQRGVASNLSAQADLCLADGHVDRARHLLSEARDLSRDMGMPGLEVVIACQQLALPGVDVGEAIALYESAQNHLQAQERIQALALLWRASGDEAYRRAGRQLLERMSARVPEEHRQSFRQDVPLHVELLRD